MQNDLILEFKKNSSLLNTIKVLLANKFFNSTWDYDVYFTTIPRILMLLDGDGIDVVKEIKDIISTKKDELSAFWVCTDESPYQFMVNHYICSKCDWGISDTRSGIEKMQYCPRCGRKIEGILNKDDVQ